MKNIYLYICAFLFSANCCNAQISLNSTSFPLVLLGTDSLKVTTYSSPFPAFISGAAATWDLTSLADTLPVYYACRVPAVSYQYADSNYYHLSTYEYQGNALATITTTGLKEYGLNVMGIKYNLASLTAAPDDTLSISGQNIMYSVPDVKISFPCGFYNSWTSNYSYDLSFELSVSMFSLLHAPGIARKYTRRHDTVTGWGQMRVKDATGGPSAYFDVLQVESTITTTDSFFLNGTLAPPAILTLLSLVQGMKDTSYIQSYYRNQEVTPMARVEFKAPSFSDPFRATTHMQRLVPVASSDLQNRQQLTIFPNPVQQHRLHISMPELNRLYTFSVTDVLGRCLQSGVLKSIDGEGRIYLESRITNGAYFLTISGAGFSTSTTRFTIDE